MVNWRKRSCERCASGKMFSLQRASFSYVRVKSAVGKIQFAVRQNGTMHIRTIVSIIWLLSNNKTTRCQENSSFLDLFEGRDLAISLKGRTKLLCDFYFCTGRGGVPLHGVSKWILARLRVTIGLVFSGPFLRSRTNGISALRLTFRPSSADIATRATVCVPADLSFTL